MGFCWSNSTTFFWSHGPLLRKFYDFLLNWAHLEVTGLSYRQPIADRVAQHLEMISKNFWFSTRRTMILMGLFVYYLVLIVNPMGRILVRWKSFTKNLEIPCHPSCTWRYDYDDVFWKRVIESRLNWAELEVKTHVYENRHVYMQRDLSSTHLQWKTCGTDSELEVKGFSESVPHVFHCKCVLDRSLCMYTCLFSYTCVFSCT